MLLEWDVAALMPLLGDPALLQERVAEAMDCLRAEVEAKAAALAGAVQDGGEAFEQHAAAIASLQVKVRYGQDVRRFSMLPPLRGMGELADKLRVTFAVPPALDLTVKYRDDEHELCE